jgi:hypothetical protein
LFQLFLGLQVRFMIAWWWPQTTQIYIQQVYAHKDNTNETEIYIKKARNKLSRKFN